MPKPVKIRGDHEHVVHAQAQLHEVAGEVLEGRLAAVLREADGAAQPEPAVVVAEVDDPGEAEGDGDVNRRPPESLAGVDDVGVGVEDEQVEREERAHEDEEQDPDHRVRAGDESSGLTTRNTATRSSCLPGGRRYLRGAMGNELAKVRVDKWLWSVRIFKSRTLASDVVRQGHVKDEGGKTLKPSTAIQRGDLLRVRRNGYDMRYRVVELIQKRVGAPIAVTCYRDETPEEELRKYDGWYVASSGRAEIREKGSGPPDQARTARDRGVQGRGRDRLGLGRRGRVTPGN